MKAKPSYLHLFRPPLLSLSLAILSAVTVVALDVLIVNTVLPTILRQIGGLHYYAWAIGAYSLGNFLTIPIFSVLEGKLGGRSATALALGIFMVGATMAALAPGMTWIVGGRLLQGMGAGGFFAIPFSLINRLYPQDLKPRAVGLVSAVWGFAAVAGPLVGAAILELWGWRWVFWINLPWAALILILTLWALKNEGKAPNPSAKLNLLSPILFAAATAFFIETLSRPWPFNGILGAATLLTGFFFFKSEKRHPSPIIPHSVWNPKSLIGVAFFAMALSAAGFGGAEAFLPLVLQGLWEATPMEAGLILTVGSIGWSFTSAGIAKFSERPRSLSLWGTLFLAIGLIGLIVNLSLEGPILWIYFAWLISGIGMGMVVPTYNTLAMDISDQFPQGVATGCLLLSMTWGFALGTPLAGILAQYGFKDGFDPRFIGLETLSIKSQEALSFGGNLALITGLVMIVFAFWFALRMPAKRRQNS